MIITGKELKMDELKDMAERSFGNLVKAVVDQKKITR